MNVKRLSVQAGCGLGLVLIAAALATGGARWSNAQDVAGNDNATGAYATGGAARAEARGSLEDGRAAQSVGGFEINWFTVDGGGGTSAGGTFSLTGTMGQPDAGELEGGSFVLRGGFIQPAAPSAPPCPADINDDGVINPQDLALLLGAWGPNPGHPADINIDGTVNPQDLALLLGSWGPCPT